MTFADAMQRYVELLTHVDHPDWWIFVVGATDVIEKHLGVSLPVTTIGLVEAKKRGVDLTAAEWRLLLWEIGAHADFIERLQRATERPDAEGDSGDVVGE